MQEEEPSPPFCDTKLLRQKHPFLEFWSLCKALLTLSAQWRYLPPLEKYCQWYFTSIPEQIIIIASPFPSCYNFPVERRCRNQLKVSKILPRFVSIKKESANQGLASFRNPCKIFKYCNEWFSLASCFMKINNARGSSRIATCNFRCQSIGYKSFIIQSIEYVVAELANSAKLRVLNERQSILTT